MIQTSVLCVCSIANIPFIANMVAPLIMSRPTRVFARLTFTGEDKSAAPLICDLSRVAAIVPANRLPSTLTDDNPPPPKPGDDTVSIVKDMRLSVLCNDSQSTKTSAHVSQSASIQSNPSAANPSYSQTNVHSSETRSNSRGVKRSRKIDESEESNSKLNLKINSKRLRQNGDNQQSNSKLRRVPLTNVVEV